MNKKIYKGYELAEAVDNGILSLEQKVKSVDNMTYFKCTIDFVLKDVAKNIMFEYFEILEDNTEKQEYLRESWKEVGKRVGEWAKEFEQGFEQGFKESFTEIVTCPFKKLEDNTEEIDIQSIEEIPFSDNTNLRDTRDLIINQLVKAVKKLDKDINYIDN